MAIVKYKQEHDGNSPTYRIIMRDMDYQSVSVIEHHLNSLKEAGLLKIVDERIEIGGKWSPPREIGI